MARKKKAARKKAASRKKASSQTREGASSTVDPRFAEMYQGVDRSVWEEFAERQAQSSFAPPDIPDGDYYAVVDQVQARVAGENPILEFTFVITQDHPDVEHSIEGLRPRLTFWLSPESEYYLGNLDRLAKTLYALGYDSRDFDPTTPEGIAEIVERLNKDCPFCVIGIRWRGERQNVRVLYPTDENGTPLREEDME